MSEDKSENSYRNIFRNTSIFGSVQVFLVLVNILRGKLVAVILGPAGMGISSLFTSTANVLTQVSSLGINLAIVKEVSEAQSDRSRMSALKTLVMRLIGVLALVGALITCLCSRWLSELAFGTPAYQWQFVLLGVFVLFTNLWGGYFSILQGLHEVKRLSRASLVGALAGLFLGVPLYWFFGYRGIVPAMIVLSVTMYIFYRVNLGKALKVDKSAFRWRDHKATIRKLLLLGVVLMLSDLAVKGTTCALNIFIRYGGDLNAVGFYQAGISITTQYVGTVFTALSLDYFPRLAAGMADSDRMNTIVNRQSVMVSLIMCPLVCLLLLSAPVLIPLLLSSEFESITPFVRLLSLVMLTRGFLFPLGYIAFAGNRKRLFFWLEVVTANSMTLVLSLLGYHLGGLNGLAIGMIADNVLCLGLYIAVNSRAFGYRMSRRTAREYGIAATFCLAAWGASSLAAAPLRWTLLGTITAAALIYSFISIRRVIRTAAE